MAAVQQSQPVSSPPVSNRASLLAGLRTGGPRLSAGPQSAALPPASGFAAQQQSQLRKAALIGALSGRTNAAHHSRRVSVDCVTASDKNEIAISAAHQLTLQDDGFPRTASLVEGHDFQHQAANAAHLLQQQRQQQELLLLAQAQQAQNQAVRQAMAEQLALAQAQAQVNAQKQMQLEVMRLQAQQQQLMLAQQASLLGMNMHSGSARPAVPQSAFIDRSFAAQQMRAPATPLAPSTLPSMPGAASAYEQRQLAQQQIQNNLRARRAAADEAQRRAKEEEDAIAQSMAEEVEAEEAAEAQYVSFSTNTLSQHRSFDAPPTPQSAFVTGRYSNSKRTASLSLPASRLTNEQPTLPNALPINPATERILMSLGNKRSVSLSVPASAGSMAPHNTTSVPQDSAKATQANRLNKTAFNWRRNPNDSPPTPSLVVSEPGEDASPVDKDLGPTSWRSTHHKRTSVPTIKPSNSISSSPTLDNSSIPSVSSQSLSDDTGSADTSTDETNSDTDIETPVNSATPTMHKPKAYTFESGSGSVPPGIGIGRSSVMPLGRSAGRRPMSISGGLESLSLTAAPLSNSPPSRPSLGQLPSLASLRSRASSEQIPASPRSPSFTREGPPTPPGQGPLRQPRGPPATEVTGLSTTNFSSRNRKKLVGGLLTSALGRRASSGNTGIEIVEEEA